MLNNYNDIEQRLNDFQSFEHEVTSDVWQNLEGELMLNNSISGLGDLEFDIDNSIWEGIEDRITVRRPKAAVWWLPGTVAAMLLLALGAYNLNVINSVSILSSNQSDLNQLNSIKNNIDQSNKSIVEENETSNSSVSPSLNEAENIRKNSFQDLENSNTSVNADNIGKSELVETKSLVSFLSDNNNSNNSSNSPEINNKITKKKVANQTILNSTSLIAVNSLNPNTSNNKVVNKTGNDNITTVALNNNIVNNNASDNSISLVNNNAPIIQKSSNTNNNEIVNYTNENSIPLLSSSDDDNVLSDNSNVSKILKKSNTVLIDSLIKEEDLEDNLIELKENILPKDEEEKDKLKSWKLIALVGIGNFRNIEESFDVVDPTQSTPIGGLKNGGPKLETLQESEGKVGLNYINYAKPVTLSFGVQKQLTNKFGIRVGVNYSKLRTDFEIYNKKYALNLNYISVPVMGVLTVKSWKKVRINTLAHIRVEKLINHRYVVIDNEEKNYEDYYIQNEKINLLVGIGGELELDLNKNISIVTNIKINKYLFTDTQEEFIRDKQIVWPEFNIGLSQKF